MYTSEEGSSRVSGDRVSGAAKTLFVVNDDEMEGLLIRTMPLCVGSEESRETFCLVEEDEEVGLENEGNMNEATEETAIDFPNKRIDFSSSSSSNSEQRSPRMMNV